jgi:acetylornithine deacetylase/succinyl-diaminopimelate desuccinylase-like protein
LSPDALADDLRRLSQQVSRSAGQQVGGSTSQQTGHSTSQEIKKVTNHPESRSADQGDSEDRHLRTTCQLEFSGAEVAFRAEKNTPLVRAFLSSIREREGRARFVLKTGTSDMNVVGPAWRCPIVAYGPGDSALDHTPDERISLSEYIQSVEILRSVLRTVMRST